MFLFSWLSSPISPLHLARSPVKDSTRHHGGGGWQELIAFPLCGNKSPHKSMGGCFWAWSKENELQNVGCRIGNLNEHCHRSRPNYSFLSADHTWSMGNPKASRVREEEWAVTWHGCCCVSLNGMAI